ncbi:MAG: response regulator [Alphaproteobacteria bacterium]|nr:response regulator [Alphaproteobacteria bacterium]MBF0251498.1 response regulator [Alphaproteobacteria bacterium]
MARTDRIPPKRKLGAGVARRLAVFVIAFSAVVTVLLSSIQVYFDYRDNVREIEGNFAFIEESFLVSLEKSVWVNDEAQIRLLLDGLLTMPAITYARVSGEDGRTWSTGAVRSEHVLERTLDLHYIHRGQDLPIGRLFLSADLDHVYAQLSNTWLMRLALHAVQIFLVALFILALVHILVTRHLGRIAAFSHDFDVTRDFTPLTLDRKASRSPDEFDEVVSALNATTQALKTRHDDLEEQVGLRTRELQNEIIQREHAETGLRAQQGWFETLINAMPDFVCLKDGQGRWLIANSFALELFELPEDKYRGKTDPELGEYTAFYKDALCACVDSDEAAWAIGAPSRGEETIPRPDGSSRMFDVIKVPVFEDWGERRGLVVVGRDVTERRRAEEALLDAKQEAELASRAKTEFLSSMSHELRTPLNAVLGFGQLLEMSPTVMAETSNKEGVTQILKAGRHLLDLINEVLDLAKIETGRVDLETEDLDPAPVVKECLDCIRPMADKRGLSLEAEALAPGAYSVHADRTRFKQVLLNLLSNAVKYNSDNGSVSFTLRDKGVGMLRFGVADTGPGLSAEQRAHIFEPFTRLGAESTEVEGTGIGLTISRRLVEMMGGALDFESVPGRGSTFWFDLPAATVQPDVEVDPTPQAAPAKQTGRDITVLYIEDNPDNLALMRHVIDLVPGAHLVSAHTGELGLEMADVHKPDVILMDVNLPGIDGVETMKRLAANAQTAHIPVVAVSADAMPADVRRGMDAGFCAYLTKPIDIRQMIDAINRALANADRA